MRLCSVTKKRDAKYNLKHSSNNPETEFYQNKRRSEVITPGNPEHMDNNQIVDEICQQTSINISKHNHNDIPQLKSPEGSASISIINEELVTIDQNLFKGFDYNNKTSHKEVYQELVDGIPVKTTLINDEDKRIKAKRQTRKMSSNALDRPRKDE